MKILSDKNISLKSKGIYFYILSISIIDNFSAELISSESKDSITAIRSGLKELEKFGYLKREKSKDEKGHWLMKYKLN